MKEVFEANPSVEEIYVVGGMPFTSKQSADNYCASENRLLSGNKRLTVETVKRGFDTAEEANAFKIKKIVDTAFDKAKKAKKAESTDVPQVSPKVVETLTEAETVSEAPLLAKDYPV